MNVTEEQVYLELLDELELKYSAALKRIKELEEALKVIENEVGNLFRDVPALNFYEKK